MDVLKKYRVFCVTEDCYVETWKFTRPESCPNDYRHEINPLLVDELEKKKVENHNLQHVVINSKAFHETNAYYMMEGMSFKIPASSNVYIENVILSVGQAIYGMKIGVDPVYIDDSLSLIVNPDLPLGIVTTPALMGDTVLSVSDTVVCNAVPGFYVKLNDNEYKIVQKDISGSTMTILPPLLSDISAGTVVLLNIYVIKNFKMMIAKTINIGYGTLGSKFIAAGSTIRLIYENTNAVDKTCIVNFEYTY